MGRRRPWQVLRKDLLNGMTSRSYLTEDEAVRGAIAWCRQVGPHSEPFAYVHDKLAEETAGDELDRLLPQQHHVRWTEQGVLGIATWPAYTRLECDQHVRAAISSIWVDPDEAARISPDTKGTPTWQPAAGSPWDRS